MYIGRGDYSADHLSESVWRLKEIFEKPELAVAQMTGSGTLAEYLLDGLEHLKKHDIEVDKLNLAVSVAPKPLLSN